MLTGLQKIKGILDTISANDLPFKFEYLESQPTSFPCGMVVSEGFTEELQDSQNNMVTETFVIKLIFSQEESQTGYEKWMTLADLISAEFRKGSHQTLDGTSILMKIKQGLAPQFSPDYSQAVVVFGIVIEVQIIKSII